MSTSHRRYPRIARVNEVVHEVLADLLERLTDPRLELVTITGVEVTPDLRDATVFFSALAAKATAEDAAAGLRAAAPRLRAELGKQVRLKYLPKLRFREDPAIIEGQRMEEIIRGLHRDET
jgi:ribosome-binding factor A